MPKAFDLPLNEVKQWPLLLGLAGLDEPPSGITPEQALWFRQLLLAAINEYKPTDVSVDLNDEWDLSADIRNFDD
jgi:hypothetical protein